MKKVLFLLFVFAACTKDNDDDNAVKCWECKDINQNYYDDTCLTKKQFEYYQAIELGNASNTLYTRCRRKQ